MQNEKKNEKLGIINLVIKLNELNPKGVFSMIDWNTIVIQGISPLDVKYPKGYSYNSKTGITDKNNYSFNVLS